MCCFESRWRILEAKREDSRVDPNESPRGSGQQMGETDPPEART